MRTPTPVFTINNETVEVIKLFAAKLASSGITEAQAKALGMEPMLAQNTRARGHWKAHGGLPALLLLYFDPLTAESVRRNGVDMYRARCLREPKPRPKDFAKYLQPAGTGAVAYFPRILDWQRVFDDPSVPLIITEGELKAAKACLEGFPTIGLGGVWNFRDKGDGEENDTLLPELAEITWAGRRVVIIFDSDITDKPAVREASRRLANLLLGVRAFVFKATLPALGGSKTGLDDLLTAKGGKAELKRLLKTAEPVSCASADSPNPDWQTSLQRSDAGEPLANLRNAAIALSRAPALAGIVAYDQMLRTSVVMHDLPGSRMAEVTAPRPVTDNDVASVQEWMQSHTLRRMGKDVSHQAVDLVAAQHGFHPVLNYLNAVPWNRKRKLGGWLSTYLGAERTEYTEKIGEMFLVSMVARIFEPGVKVDHILVLEGPQGALKSQACEILAGAWFTDTMPDIHSKDASVHLRGKWLVELSELSSIYKSDVESLKQFISKRIERYRPPYGIKDVFEPRQCVFIGTTNKGNYLRDETGARRFWPVLVGNIDLEALRRDRDQLFAEAVHLYRQKTPWWPDKTFDEKHIKPQQDSRYETDEWESTIREFVMNFATPRIPLRLSIMDIATTCLDLPKRQVGTIVQRRISAILTRGEWTRKVAPTGLIWSPPLSWLPSGREKF